MILESYLDGDHLWSNHIILLSSQIIKPKKGYFISLIIKLL